MVGAVDDVGGPAIDVATDGRLGYGDTTMIGDDENTDSIGDNEGRAARVDDELPTAVTSVEVY